MINSKFIGGMMMAAAATMAVPAQAANISAPVGQAINLDQLRTSPLSLDGMQWDESDETANRWRRRCRRFGCRRRGIRGGDILAGALILGGIAAVASAASNNNRRRDREVIVREVPQPDPRLNQRSNASELSIAADECSIAVSGQAGNDARIDRITAVARDGAGWRVEGLIAYPQGQEQFLCGVTGGQIDYIQIGAGEEL